MAGEYANPLAGAKVTGERIDQGVDYAGTGQVSAIARGVITKVLPNGASGWPGAFLEYQITDPNSPIRGQFVYAAEGINPTVKVGDTDDAGQPIANIIPGWSTGIELGVASGVGTTSYAERHGGYVEGRSTAAGDVWDAYVTQAGGPAGQPQPGAPVGTAPPEWLQLVGDLKVSGGGPSSGTLGTVEQIIADTTNPVQAAVDAAGGIAGAVNTASDAANATASAAEAFANFLSNPIPALLTVLFIALGGALSYQGVGRMLGFDNHLASAARGARMAVPRV